ncbi:MAG: hypothetical protein O2887_10000 [Bacteroidetes bacterium]|nr:hypothetical protein [Bacteroidota bacterium]MDA1120801.1 hypothetical protein [Bacteroidota bacterium]
MLGYLSDFVVDIDFANIDFEPTVISCEGADAYGLASVVGGFGWLRFHANADVSKTDLSISIPGRSLSNYLV